MELLFIYWPPTFHFLQLQKNHSKTKKKQNFKSPQNLRLLRKVLLQFSFSPRPPFCLALVPWHCCRKWLTLPTTTRQKHIFRGAHTRTHKNTHTLACTHGFASMGRTCTWLESVWNFLIIQGLQSKQLNTAQDDSLLTLHSVPASKRPRSRTLIFKLGTFQEFTSNFPALPTAPLPPSLFSCSPLLASTCTQFCRQPIPLSSKWYANPCLDWRLTGFFAAPNTHDLIRNAGILAVKSLTLQLWTRVIKPKCGSWNATISTVTILGWFVTNEAFFMLISRGWLVSINLPNDTLYRLRITKCSCLKKKKRKIFF